MFFMSLLGALGLEIIMQSDGERYPTLEKPNNLPILWYHKKEKTMHFLQDHIHNTNWTT